MEFLFVYGTLKKPAVQRAVFGRIAKSSPDILHHFTRSKIKIDKMYPIIVQKEGTFVRGLVFPVNAEELQAIDHYETDYYKRQKVILKSGINAWVYTA